MCFFCLQVHVDGPTLYNWGGGVHKPGGLISSIIIHSKYFSISDWPKSHAWFVITSYCRPNLEEVCNMWTDGINRVAKLPDYWVVNREDLGTRLSCFRWWVQNGGMFHLFHEEEVGKLLAKNIARTTRRQLAGRNLLFGEYLQNWTTLYLLNYRR